MLDVAYGLVNLLLFFFISQVVHRPGASAPVGTASYFDFVAVGLAYLLVVQATCTHLIAKVQQQQRSGTLESTVALPVSPPLIAVGMGAYPAIIGIGRTALYLMAATALLGLQVGQADWWGLTLVLILGAAAALAVGITLAAAAVAFAHGATFGRLAVVALGFLSGAYFPVSALPTPLQWISAALPTRMAIDGMRIALVGGAWGATAAILLTAATVALPLSALLFAQALRRARRTGTVSRA